MALLLSLLEHRTSLLLSLRKQFQRAEAEILELHSNMKNTNHNHVIGIPLSLVSCATGRLQGKPVSASDTLSLCLHSPSCMPSRFKPRKVELVINWMSNFSKKADNYAQSIRDHVSLAPKISDTVKGKLNLGTRILQAGGIGKVFRRSFSVGKGEKLLKASQCYLSTTAGPISGLLFISTEKIAFQSDLSLTFASPKGELARIPYKVLIPLRRIEKASPSENANKPNQKYIQIVTEDGFEFWFMGFLSYKRSFKYLQQAISEEQMRNS